MLTHGDKIRNAIFKKSIKLDLQKLNISKKKMIGKKTQCLSKPCFVNVNSL